MYKPPNRKGKRHHVDCLHDEPGVTLCVCEPLTIDEALLELAIFGFEQPPVSDVLRNFVPEF